MLPEIQNLSEEGISQLRWEAALRGTADKEQPPPGQRSVLLAQVSWTGRIALSGRPSAREQLNRNQTSTERKGAEERQVPAEYV